MAAARGAQKIDIRQCEAEFIRRKKYEGTFDIYFDTVARLRTQENPRFLIEIIEDYVVDSAKLIARVEREIGEDTAKPNDKEEVDCTEEEKLEVTIQEFRRCLSNQPTNLFNDNVLTDLYQLRGCSSSLGGARVVAACLEVLEVYRGSKGSCSEPFKKLKREYETFRDALIAIKQMETVILLTPQVAEGAGGSAGVN